MWGERELMLLYPPTPPTPPTPPDFSLVRNPGFSTPSSAVLSGAAFRVQ
ncbi:hypothetical protein H6G98_27045 [Nostoc sp. FACHB-857]|nr:hypothetical protein [Nostoc sp. FACHB-857]